MTKTISGILSACLSLAVLLPAASARAETLEQLYEKAKDSISSSTNSAIQIVGALNRKRQRKQA